MTIKNIGANALLSYFMCVGLFTTMICPPAEARDDKITNDRQLAKKLSETLAVVAAEGKQFVSTRNAMSKARLQLSQRLSDNLAELERARAIDLQVWEVVGEEYRLKLFNGVLTATATAIEQYEAQVNRKKQNKRDLAAIKSAVNFQSSELLSAGRSLAALSEPPSVNDTTELFNQLAEQLTGEATVRAALLEAGKDHIETLKSRILKNKLEDKESIPVSAP